MTSLHDVDDVDTHTDGTGGLDDSHARPATSILTNLRRWGWIPMLAVSLGLLGGAWSLSSPIGSSPDDDFHLGSLWCSDLAPDELCRPTARATSSLDEEIRVAIDNGSRLVRVPAGVGPGALCFAFDPTASAACQNEVSATEFVESRANDGLYPGGYYLVMGALVSSSEGRSVVLIRFASFLAAVSLIVGAAIAASPHLRRAYVLAVLATSIPLGLFLFASTNPSGMAVAGVGAAFVCANAYLRASSKPKLAVTGALGAAAALSAFMARSDAGLYVAVACACALVLERAWHRTMWTRSLGVILIAALGLLSLALSTQTSSATDGIGTTESTASLGTILWNNVVNLPSLWAGSLGVGWGLGWLDTRLPDVVGVGMVLAAGGLLLWGLGDVRRAKLLTAAIALLTITFIPLYLLAADRRLVGETVQPRYLLPMLVVVFTICLIPANEYRRSLNRTQIVSIGIVFCVAHSISLHSNIRRYVTGQEVRGVNLNTSIEWWWPIDITPMGVWFIGSAAFVIVAGIALTRGLRVPAEDDSHSASGVLSADDISPATTERAYDTSADSAAACEQTSDVGHGLPEYEDVLTVETHGEMT